jgi:hypothetical protein
MVLLKGTLIYNLSFLRLLEFDFFATEFKF